MGGIASLLYYVLVSVTIFAQNGICKETISKLAVVQNSHFQAPIAITAETLEDLINYGNIFIDRTLFIEELISHRPEYQARVIARPKGWGKSVNLNTLRTFFEAKLNETTYKIIPRNETSAFRLFKHSEVISPKGGVRKLDRPLLITKHQELLRMHQGLYPVVYLDFAGMTGRHSVEFEVEFLDRIRQAEDKYNFTRMAEILKADGQYVDKNMLKILGVDIENKPDESKTTTSRKPADSTGTRPSTLNKPAGVGQTKPGGSKDSTGGAGSETVGSRKPADGIETKTNTPKMAVGDTTTKTTHSGKPGSSNKPGGGGNKTKPGDSKMGDGAGSGKGPKKTQRFGDGTKINLDEISQEIKLTHNTDIPGIRIIGLEEAELLEKMGPKREPKKKAVDEAKNKTETVSWSKRFKCFCNFLGIFFKRKPVVLIDNYDDPIMELIASSGVLKRMDAVETIWKLYNTFFEEFKNDTRFYTHLVACGMMRLGQPTLMFDHDAEQSGQFAQYTGFNVKEVNMIFDHLDIPDDLRKEAFPYYSGYQFSPHEFNISGASSIAQFVEQKKIKCYIYSNGSVDKYFHKCIRDVDTSSKEDPISRHLCGRILRDGSQFIKFITELSIKHFAMVDTLPGEISRVLPTTTASLCYAAGYITLRHSNASEEAYGEVEVRIPNEQVKDLLMKAPQFKYESYERSPERNDTPEWTEDHFDDENDKPLVTEKEPLW